MDRPHIVDSKAKDTQWQWSEFEQLYEATRGAVYAIVWLWITVVRFLAVAVAVIGRALAPQVRVLVEGMRDYTRQLSPKYQAALVFAVALVMVRYRRGLRNGFVTGMAMLRTTARTVALVLPHAVFVAGGFFIIFYSPPLLPSLLKSCATTSFLSAIPLWRSINAINQHWRDRTDGQVLYLALWSIDTIATSFLALFVPTILETCLCVPTVDINVQLTWMYMPLTRGDLVIYSLVYLLVHPTTDANDERINDDEPAVDDDQQDPEPELEPTTAYCNICMDNEPIDEIFSITGCEHTYCRASIHHYVLDRIDLQDVAPKCPRSDCTTTIPDPMIASLLTEEELQRYYDASIMKAVNDEATLHKCRQDGCRGVGVLPLGNPRFVCPLCNSQCCVQCNTREWHDGLTCAQARQRGLDSELHPQQLRAMYRGRAVYQCGRCSFGPIEHFACANVATHHNQIVGNGRVNNTCPRCGWFVADIAHWPRWNGEMPTSVN